MNDLKKDLTEMETNGAENQDDWCEVDFEATGTLDRRGYRRTVCVTFRDFVGHETTIQSQNGSLIFLLLTYAA